MKPQELKSSISDIENDLMSSAKVIEAQVEKLKSDLQDLKTRIEQKNKEIAELKCEQAEFINLFDKVFAILDQQPRQKLLDDLHDMERQITSLVGMVAASPSPDVAKTLFTDATSPPAGVTGTGELREKRDDNSPALGPIHLSMRKNLAGPLGEPSSAGPGQTGYRTGNSQ